MLHPSRRELIKGTAALAALHASGAAAQTPAPAAFGEDAALLRRAYTALHPGLYRYNTPAQMDGHFDDLARTLAPTCTIAQAYVAVARLTSAVRCGHSYPNFYNQSYAIQTALFAGRNRLPFLFAWIDGHMIVLRDLSPSAVLAPGTEVLTIGGIPAARILAALMPLLRADGHNDAKRVRNLEVHGEDTWEAFDVYWPMLFPALVADATARLNVRAPDGTARALTLPLMTSKERTAKIPTAATKTADAPLWTMRREGHTAWLTMPDWGVYNSKWPWETWLTAQLDSIASDGTRALVIDLRGNEGGQDCGDLVTARLIREPVAQLATERRVRYRKLPVDLSTHVDTWDDSFRDWGAGAIGPDAAGFYRLTRFDDDASGRTLIRPAGKPFAGKVIILTDAANSSATFQFAQTMKERGLATLIGEPTGGNRRGINGGAFLFLRLPATGIEVDIPLIGFFPATPQPDAGIVPDIAVRRTAHDVAIGADPVRATALALASRG